MDMEALPSLVARFMGSTENCLHPFSARVSVLTGDKPERNHEDRNTAMELGRGSGFHLLGVIPILMGNKMFLKILTL